METDRGMSSRKTKWGLVVLVAVLAASVALSGCIASRGPSTLSNTGFGTVQATANLTAMDFGPGKTQTLEEYGIVCSTNRDDVVRVDGGTTGGARWVLGGGIEIPSDMKHVRYLRSDIVDPSQVGTITATLKGLKPGTTYFFRFYTVGKRDDTSLRYVNINEVITLQTSDPTLKSLTKSRGTLSPKFSKTKYTYTNTISRYTSGSRITVVPTLAGSSVQMKVGSGAFGAARSKYVKVSRGKSKVLTVRVTAPDGIAKDYVVTVKRKK